MFVPLQVAFTDNYYTNDAIVQFPNKECFSL